MLKPERNSSPENRGRERSPMGPNDDRNDEDSNLSANKDRNREKERDRSRRGDRPSRFGPRSSSPSRERDRERDRGGKKSAADRRIFVSNIAYEYRWQELKDLFRTEVGEVAYVELFTDENDKPRGCGIVEFENPESVKKAVEKMHRYELNGRKLVVKEDYDVERDKYGRPQKGGGGGGGGRNRDEPRGKWEPNPAVALNPLGANAAAQNKWGNTYGLSPQFLESLWINGPLVSRVFVANLDYKVDEKKLKEVFKLAGRVVSAELSLDKEGKSRGFGVVEYEHPVEAVQAISMLHNQMLYDRKLTVRMDRVDHKQDGPPKLPEGLRGLGMGLGAGGQPLQDVSRNLPSAAQAASALVGAVPAGAAGLGAGLGAGTLSNVLGRSSIAGLGNTAAGLPTGLAGVGGLGGGGLIGSSLGAGGDIGLAGGLGGTGAFGGSGLGGALGPAASGLGGGLAAGAAGLGGGSSNYGSGLGGAGSGSYLGGGGGGGYGSGSSNALGGGSGFGRGGQDFDSLSAALGGGGGGGGYNAGMPERDYRAGGGSGGGYANGPGRGSLGGGGGGGNGARGSDTIIVKNLPPSVTWQMLRDKFREVGDVKFAEMRGKDVGLVRFNSEWDAERAVHMMDRSRFEGRSIDVCLFY